MAIIPLRQYNREIENLIDTAQLDEAVAHCRHILETFPKHIATYRLLGKAYLEQQRFGDAADIFQRVLSSVPDDYVANIGLSIIREDEGNLDASIWYMERALEAQPSNSAIKDELRRLYGRRDGIEPPKVRLTRGALARMYSRGGLYDQAVAELRAALVDDPHRPDLMVLLAQMYFYLGQQVEAVDTCGNVMKRLPYCLVANRILSSILPQTGRADDTKTYHQRVIAMDPYFASAPDNMLAADSVPDSAINIERLSYRPGQAAGGSAQPAWAASLGIAFEESQSDQLPDWLQDQSALESEAKPAAHSIPVMPFSWEKNEEEAASTEEPASPEDAIPEWMKQAGWQPATGTAPEKPLSFDLDSPTELPEGEIAKGEIPDWLKGLAPSGALDEEPTSEPGTPDELDLPWLQKTTPGASDTIVNWLGAQKPVPGTHEETEEPTPPEADLGGPRNQSAAPGEEGGLPDWLQGVETSYGRSGITDWLKTSHVDEYEASLEPSAGIPEQSEEEIPDWLKEMGEPTAELAPVEPVAEEPALPAEELPEWLKEMGEPIAELAPVEPVVEEPALPAEELPDWLKEMGEPTAELAPVEPVAEEPALPAEELPDWLKEIGAPTAELTPAEPVTEEPALPAVELPDWLKEMGEPTAELEPVEPVDEPALSAEELPDWLKEMDEPAVEPAVEEPALPAEELPDWLEEIGAPTAELAPVEPVTEEPALPAEELPDWLKEMSEPTAELASDEPVAEEPALPAEELPDWLKEMGEPTAELAPVEPVAEAPALPAEELPEWAEHVDLPVEEIETSKPESEDEVAPFEDVPYWLKETAKITPAELSTLPVDITPEETSLPEIVLPDWLHEIGPDETTAQPSSPFSEQSNQEAALSWLESLAAKHGAKEEELITRPDERQETMPDWIKLEAEQSQPDEPIAVPPSLLEEPAQPSEELPDWIKEIAEPTAEAAPVEPAPASPTPFMEQSDQDAALAWLEKLAAQHGAREEELITRPEERQETIPDWVRLGAEEALQAEPLSTEPTEIETPALPAEELPEWLKEMAEPSEVPAPEEPIAFESGTPAQEVAVPAEELPEWLQEMAEPPADIAPVTPIVETPSTQLDLSDQDAALAWLESLAAQHGAKEEELITRPEERLDIMPEWIKQEAESSPVTEEVPTQPVPVEGIIPATPVETSPIEGELLPEALLEPAEPVSEPGLSEEPVMPETELPDWLAETPLAPQVIDIGEEQAEEEQLPDWLKEAALPEPELPADDLAGDMQKLPDWLKEVDQFAIDEVSAFPSTELPATPAWMPEAILPETDLPTPPAYVLPEPPADQVVETELPVQEPESLPSEPFVLDINTASLAQFEHLPGVGFVAAQNIIAYRDANGPFSSIDDLTQVDGVEPALVEALRAQLTTTIPEAVLEAAPLIDTEESIYTSARHALAEGDISLAVNLYTRLVAQRADLDQVITDMQEALYRYPLDINFWQIMGDAYLRTDKLQEALDAYTEAEELLR